MERTFYIGTGEQTKMFTLRTQYETEIPVESHNGTLMVPVVMDYYLQNLSIDADKAVKRAQELGFSVTKPKFSLNEIKRREERLEQQKIQAIREAEEAERVAHIDKMMMPIHAGLFPFGRYRDQSFADVYVKDRGYIEYWTRLNIKDEDIVAKNLQKVLRAAYPETMKDKTGNGEFFGEVKKRYRGLKAEVVKTLSFDSFYGTTFITQFVLESGELVVYMGGTYLEVAKGDTVTMDFTVKSHEVYKEVNQTKILRVKFK